MSKIHNCRSCGSNQLSLFLSLGNHPLANALLTADKLGQPEQTYPLDVVLCTSCSLVQITETVPPEVLFRDYIYFSSFSDTTVKNAEILATRLLATRKLDKSSLVVELASNDGYLLRHFVQAGVPVLGVEPARNIAKVAEERGIRTMADFFGLRLAQNLAAEGQRADVILANNVMAHVPDLNGVVAGVKVLLKPDGVFVMETPYVKDMIDKLEFDTMYHEHLYCHSLTGLEHLFQRHGLVASNVEWLPVHGGTLRVTAVHVGQQGERTAVRKLLTEEAIWGVASEGFYKGFGDRVQVLGQTLRETLGGLKRDGRRIAAYGAAAKGTTLLNSFAIGRDVIDYVVDRSTYKQGKYMPGSHIPICAPERLLEDRPDYVLLLAWNLADEIMEQQMPYRQAGGRFIVPVPQVRIV